MRSEEEVSLATKNWNNTPLELDKATILMKVYGPHQGLPERDAALSHYLETYYRTRSDEGVDPFEEGLEWIGNTRKDGSGLEIYADRQGYVHIGTAESVVRVERYVTLVQELESVCGDDAKEAIRLQHIVLEDAENEARWG